MKKRIKYISAAAVLLLLLAAFCWVQNNWITVSEYVYTSEKITDQADGYRIVHISDLHNKSFGKEQQRLISKVAECQPDIILVTGDIVDRSRTDIDTAVFFIREACRIAPVYYVTGNHERDLSQADFDELTGDIEAAGVVWLENEVIQIQAGTNTITLAGLDNMNLCDDTLAALAEQYDNEHLTVLLAHQPHFIDFYSQYKPDIVLSGHAHGGQWRLPFIGGLIAPGQGFFPEYTEGTHVADSTTMYISRGLGNSAFPLRLFNYPEVVCVKLKSK